MRSDPFDQARLATVAARQVAPAWLLAGSPATLAIPGTGDVAHLEENVAASALALTGEDLDEPAQQGRTWPPAAHSAPCP